jgi:hypothetical protein
LDTELVWLFAPPNFFILPHFKTFIDSTHV